MSTRSCCRCMRKGLTTGEISRALRRDLRRLGVARTPSPGSPTRCSRRCRPGAARPLEQVYAAIFIDAIMVKVRDGQVGNRPSMPRSGSTWTGTRTSSGCGPATAAGSREVLDERAHRPEEPRRGRRVLRGLRRPEGPARRGQHGVVPQAIVQTCIIHLIRNTFRYASRKYWDQIAKRPQADLHRANAEAAAWAAFDEFAEKWGRPYPAIIRLWDNAWERVHPVPGLRRRDPQGHLLAPTRSSP